MERRLGAWVWRIALLFSCWLPQAQGAEAQATDPARSASARALFEQGVQHTDRQEWTLAAEAFRRALLLRDSPVIRYNLASALAEQGQVVEASELLHAVQADANASAELKQQADEALREVFPRIARLTIHPAPFAGALGIKLDGAPLASAQLGVPLLLDPGHHELLAYADETEFERRTVELAEGESAELQLVPPPAPAPPAPEPAPVVAHVPTPEATARLALPLVRQQAEPRSDTAPDSSRRKRLGWGLGLGAVALGAAVAVAVLLIPRARHSGSSASSSGDFDPPSVGVRVPQ
jgi:hypothetical protein